MEVVDVPKGTCSVDGCEKPLSARGWCAMHWYRWRVNGDPNRVRQIRLNHIQRFMSKVQLGPGGCWLWPDLRSNGYGHFWQGEREEAAHVWAYRKVHGAVPEGMDVDHLCRVRHCVNPDHLEAVSRLENVRRGAKRQTACSNGHPFLIAGYFERGGVRRCHLCDLREAV